MPEVLLTRSSIPSVPYFSTSFLDKRGHVASRFALTEPKIRCLLISDITRKSNL